MIFRLHRSRFLRGREALHELVALEEAGGSGGLSLDRTGESIFDRRTVRGYFAQLETRGLLQQSGSSDHMQYRLTDAGRRRLRYLLVDYVNELAALHESARDILRRSLAPLSLAGVRRVAFYPHGETAEVAFSVLESVDLELVGIVDDSRHKWNLTFHHLRVRPPAELALLRPDAVIVTTSMFEDQVVENVRVMELEGVRIHTL